MDRPDVIIGGFLIALGLAVCYLVATSVSPLGRLGDILSFAGIVGW